MSTETLPERRILGAGACDPYLGRVNLNLGCGCHPFTDETDRGQRVWINLDRVPGWADVICELGTETIPLPSDSVDCVFASHVLEHIPDLIHAMREIHRVLVPGGHLVAATPYASSDGAWDDPTHCRAFTQNSWQYFDARLYQTPGRASHYPSPVDFCFDVVQIGLIAEPDLQDLPEAELRRRMRFERNIIMELQAILRKVVV
jgi:SAM-dependent methyltransferase